ncbi:hypothetical protein [Natronosalvus rutilus]|uniref:Uncharacterized protein n=1 Tax=Natronosalvus rutilus TaxID=2953753 RepID=A0A9E7SW12_9EURY|nr:hypothetical protein [Natronosalvus rutilus]UTF52783.1 hypothetical protein NGM29_13450 [Natronosalvus rutilus]
MSVHAYVPESSLNLDRNTHNRVLELADEDPVRFIRMDEPDTALAVIRGIDSIERLAGWRLANQSFFDPPKSQITEALDAREREILGEPVDSSTSSEKIETGPTSSALPEAPVSDPSPNHPDSRLETDEVLVIERGDRTEYVTPASAGADAPYVSRTIDENGDVWNENDDLRNDDLLRRLNGEHERTTIDDAPAALGGGR